MPNLVIRIHPIEPITGNDFTTYLDGLSISAHEVSFNHPDGTGPEIGSAKYIPPSSPDFIDTGIVQHQFGNNLFAVATAVIQIPPILPGGEGEYRTADVRLVITRGNSEIVHKQLYYNVPVDNFPIPSDPNEFQNIKTTSIYLALPKQSSTFMLPEDGTIPNFMSLRTNVETVLNAENVSGLEITNLTPSQCRQIAYEIIWDPMAYPLPVPAPPVTPPDPNRKVTPEVSKLEEMYTGPPNSNSAEEQDRKIFEGELLTYYVKHNYEADRLAHFVFSLSTAIWFEEEKSKKAKQAIFSFPVFPALLKGETKVILKGTVPASDPILEPVFEVPAEYFYALTAVLPPQVNREQRFKIITSLSEEQVVSNIEQAIYDQVLTEPVGVNRFQVARRLRALGAVTEIGTPAYVVTPATPVYELVNKWLKANDEDINVSFWQHLFNIVLPTLPNPDDITGHLNLLLCAITKAYEPLENAIQKPSFGVASVSDLENKTRDDWENLFNSNPGLLPDFTKPGTTEEQIQTFIRHLRKFLEVKGLFKKANSSPLDAAPILNRSVGNPLDQLLLSYPSFSFVNGWSTNKLKTKLKNIFPDDQVAQKRFTEWLTCIQGVLNLTKGITPSEMQFSVMEALWARGFTSKTSIKGLTFEDFREALVGSVAYDLNLAQLIWKNFKPVNPSPISGPAGFKPINPDGSLMNCIPPLHLSPLGPVAYLHDLLRVSANSTCEKPISKAPKAKGTLLNSLLKIRRGPLGDLLATQSNLEVPLPLIDLVNESLEYMVANNDSSGVVYNTANKKVGGHELTSAINSTNSFQHDPVTLFEVLPEHSTPAVLTKNQPAYDKLEKDFSSCRLPYSQPLDISRTYLEQLGTRRFATMRHFRKAITEFVLDPKNEPAEFQSHLWRYPVRIETAIEYLNLSSEEYNVLYQKNIDSTELHTFYGFNSKNINGKPWTDVVVSLAEFLKRTCLTYCEFLELWKSEFVKFILKDNHENGFPDCEPCCLDEYLIEFEDPADPEEALKRLAIFIRLWRTLQIVPNACYTFTELRDICDVLELFIDTNQPNVKSINSDFIRQLAAFQMFRDDFQLSLTDGITPSVGGTGADRLHLLAFWFPGASKWDWAVEHLLNQIQKYAINKYECSCRGAEFIKLLSVNLKSLSVLSGFNPNNSNDTWHKHPTNTLRFAEILTKIYVSEFGVGELLFLFTSEEHLQGDDPFPLQTVNEAKDSPFGLPDDEDQNSLWALRRKLMAVEVSDEAVEQWSWLRIESTLKDEFNYELGNNRWLSLGQHFFPTVLADSGITVTPLQRQYRVPLASPTSELMWNTPPDGPYHYDVSAQELWTDIPLADESVLAKLSRIRQLSDDELGAVRDLYFLPRVDLAYFSFVFNNFGEAEEHLMQEPEEAKRWRWFQQEFARFYQRCQVIAEHLATHIVETTGRENAKGVELAKQILKNLWADENKAITPWENDNGQSPLVTWKPQPNGGALAALLGLIGTGMQAEYFDFSQKLRWREVRGGLEAFGVEENAWNAPIPTIMPVPSAKEFTFSQEQLRFAALRNGFAMANSDGLMLGGAEPFVLHWKGQLLIEKEGSYGFSVGAPTATGLLPNFETVNQSHRWRVILRRGQKSWVLLSHDWPNEEAPAHCTTPIRLKQGIYELNIELERKPLDFDGPEDVCPQTTGFQLKYQGPDVCMEWSAIPFDKLFREKKDGTLQSGINLSGAAQNFLAVHFTSTVRDIRRTYQRAFKAMLLASRFRLSVEKVADDGQSELGYILSHPFHFVGQSYYHSGGAFVTHKANFDLNFLPVLDNYEAPLYVQDQRVAPTVQRQQAMFDWWERLFDYTVMRFETQRSPERPAWLLFHESAELHPDSPAHLVRHLGIDLRHDTLVLQYYPNYSISSFDLEDDRWAVRVWHSERWIRELLKNFYAKDIREARPDLWASDEPSITENAFNTKDSGNQNLTQFYRNGCIENGEPRRYEEIKRLNDGLRKRGRDALVAYLTHMNRVKLPWNGFATEAKHLSELLLIDVETEICQKASRIEEAISAIQLFTRRARLGLELDPQTYKPLVFSQDFVMAWNRHFATFRIWEACQRRLIYRENWIEWDEWQKAQQTEAFQFLESELRRATLTIPVPGGLAYWNGQRPPVHPGIKLLQHREPAAMELLDPVPEGLGLMGTPDRHARPNWLAPVRGENHTPESNPIEVKSHRTNSSLPLTTNDGQEHTSANLPMWLQAAVRLGTKFIRVAAAGIPPATTTFDPKCGSSEVSVCCSVCNKTHPALMDEYYFWIEESRYYNETKQDADWRSDSNNPLTDWHRPEKLPDLLYWKSKPMVHLRWCRVHNGEFQEPRKSSEGVQIKVDPKNLNIKLPYELDFLGRSEDSLYFNVKNGENPEGYLSTPLPGFRYDLATDEVITLPNLVIPASTPVGGLVSFPYFALFDLGAPLLPSSFFSTGISVAGHLRAHCQFEAALKWYELVYKPLLNDNSWITCVPKQPEPPVGPSGDLPIEVRSTHLAEGCCCASAPVSDKEMIKERAILLHYLETQLQWGDAMMRKNTPEAFQQARLIFDTVAKILGATPITVLSKDEASQASTVADFNSACAPINPRLMCLYTSVTDRLALIHSCMNANRLKNGRPNLDMPYFGNGDIRECWKNTNEVCTEESDWCLLQSPYRFVVLVQKALEVAGEVRTLGSALLAAYEKGDAEYLSTMRTMHERQLLNLTLEVRQNQWREADWQVQALQKNKEIAQTRLQYYNNLIANGLISGEIQYEPLTISSTTVRSTINIIEATGQAMNLVPDPNLGFPCNFFTMPPGSKMSQIFAAAGRIATSAADILNTQASLGLTKAGWERREQEWKHQVDILEIEIEQIERQILAAERHRSIALRELNTHQQQMENAVEVHDFLRDKFTNHELYLWMQQETAAMYYQMYEKALHYARQAQRAFNFERGHTARQFIPAEIWDNLHEGLLAGERLQLSLRQMEKAYYDENVREYELTKNISLRFHFPMAFLQLQSTGYCEIDIPEWMFDLDYPGHYMRRIKNVTMSIPCVVGPYTGIHCRLTLLSSKTRVDPRLVNPPHTCCNDEHWKNGYQAIPDDTRIVSMYGATEAIATSSGQNDSGMFELNFRDERYLPFEFSGAVSRWRIELPLENNQFDMETLSDLILHLNFTTREGGENLRKAANEYAQQNLPGAGLRFFDVKREFPEAWYGFASSSPNSPATKQLGIQLSRNMFPYLAGRKKVRVTKLEILFESPGADPSAHHIVEFLIGQHVGQIKGKKCDCNVHSIACVADANWPGIFHGVLEVEFEVLSVSEYQNLGVFRFPIDIGEITNTYLFCSYERL
ncbi:neuraminidase-like domain-containing protein [Bacillus cereus]|uniref:Tc toxin subunit A-related protein n=1 Tax=Bacillus cereus TaxID=1396 RepID=UPI001CFEEF72